MSYTPHTWAVGDVITAERLNALEQAVANTSSFDAEIKIYHDNNSSSNYVFTIESGTFASLYAKLSNGIAPVILARVYNDAMSIRSATTAVPIYSFDNSSFMFIVKVPTGNMEGTYTNEWLRLGYLYWNSNDEIGID